MFYASKSEKFYEYAKKHYFINYLLLIRKSKNFEIYVVKLSVLKNVKSSI